MAAEDISRQVIDVEANIAGTSVVESRVSGDDYARFALHADGSMLFGDGTAAPTTYINLGSNEIDLTVEDVTADSLVVGSVPIYDTTLSDIDAQNGTITAARLASGLIVHTSTTGGGTATLDTGANIGSGIPLLNTAGRTLLCVYVNDGDQTVTFAGDTGTTIADTGQTVAANESCLLVVRCTAANTFTVYLVGA